MQYIQGVKLQQDECIISYDVKALFTSVPIVPAINMIIDKLTKDKDLQQRSPMTVHHIISLLEFCLKTTYFQFQGRYFEQQHRATMGSPISFIVAKLDMEEFEIRAIKVAEHPPQVWKRYVDDIFVVTNT